MDRTGRLSGFSNAAALRLSASAGGGVSASVPAGESASSAAAGCPACGNRPGPDPRPRGLGGRFRLFRRLGRIVAFGGDVGLGRPPETAPSSPGTAVPGRRPGAPAVPPCGDAPSGLSSTAGAPCRATSKETSGWNGRAASSAAEAGAACLGVSGMLPGRDRTTAAASSPGTAGSPSSCATGVGIDTASRPMRGAGRSRSDGARVSSPGAPAPAPVSAPPGIRSGDRSASSSAPSRTGEESASSTPSPAGGVSGAAGARPGTGAGSGPATTAPSGAGLLAKPGAMPVPVGSGPPAAPSRRGPSMSNGSAGGARLSGASAIPTAPAGESAGAGMARSPAPSPPSAGGDGE